MARSEVVGSSFIVAARECALLARGVNLRYDDTRCGVHSSSADLGY